MNVTLSPELTNDYYDNIRSRNYINFAINTLATIIAGFIIVYRSSKAMKVYKWFLLNITIWSYIWDFNMTLFFVPLFLFPSPVVCSLGLAKDIFGISPLTTAVPFCFLIVTLSGCGAAIACALYYRYKLLSSSSTVIFTKKYFLIGMLLFHFVSGLPLLITALLSDISLDSNYWYNYIKREFPLQGEVLDFCVHSLNIHQPMCLCGGVVIGTTGTNIMSSAILIELVFYFLLVIFGPLYIYYCLRKSSKMITQMKYNHERKLILSLSMQSIIPVFCLAIPYFYAFFDFIFELESPTLLAFLVQLSTLHSFFNAITMILMLKPYREALKDAFLFICFRNRVSNAVDLLDQGNHIHVQEGNLQQKRISRPIIHLQIRNLNQQI